MEGCERIKGRKKCNQTINSKISKKEKKKSPRKDKNTKKMFGHSIRQKAFISLLTEFSF